MFSLLKFLSPLRAYRDLRGFLVQRRPHELVFMVIAAFLTMIVIAGFVHDSRVEVPYKENIIYVESWPLNRSDAEIRAQQKIDMEKQREDAEKLEKLRAERRAQFQRIDNSLDSWGF
ncbi:hypothetical protein [Stakelama pacifica]|uniref:hypothetical protein n=1 Tax=Stakelama pacifica TaxID=517720 RepID=UPI000C554C32|nr:hypothetical protein [Stakelama pacifica]MAW99303.1 hypothetical protein [Sphingomonas sp.]GGO95200.1 hypothetical protein GCM10011329_18830 [Stakelama pacifica]